MKWYRKLPRYLRLISLLLTVWISFMLIIITFACKKYEIDFEVKENLAHSIMGNIAITVESECHELFCPLLELEPSDNGDNAIGTLSLLSQKYVSIELVVRDISKYKLNDIYVLEVVFSAALVPDQNFSNFIKLLDINYQPILGEWRMLDNYMGVAFYGSIPSTELFLLIDTGLMGLNGLILLEQQIYQLKPAMNSHHYLIVSPMS